MNMSDKEKLIQAVVSEVLKVMEGHRESESAAEGIDKMLVIGDVHKVPADLKDRYILCGIEDYEKYHNIHRYQKVIITELSMTSLADTALGRAGDCVSSVLIEALLAGLDVSMLKCAISHRKYAGQGSTKLYALLEGYVNTLQTFGVRLIAEKKQVIVKEAKPPKFMPPQMTVPQGSAKPNPEKLITEDKAAAMIADCDGTVCLCKNAIITPSAWDVFDSHKIKVVRQ